MYGFHPGREELQNSRTEVLDLKQDIKVLGVGNAQHRGMLQLQFKSTLPSKDLPPFLPALPVVESEAVD